MLTDTKVRAAKAQEKPYKLADAGGLHLYVTPSGTRVWRWRYEVKGKEKLLTLGQYPGMTLAAARDTRDAARKSHKAGRDPALDRKLEKAAADAAALNTFEKVARGWHALQRSTWSEQHAGQVIESLVDDVFPAIGGLALPEITEPMVLALLRAIEARGAVETAHRVRQRISAAFVFGMSEGIKTGDPAAIVKKALKPVKRGRQPALTKLPQLREMLAASEALPAHPATKLAHRFLALTAVRSTEMRELPWGGELEGLDGPEPLWVIPAARMKMDRDHLVPLPRQAVDVLDAIRKLTGRGPFVFPNARWAHRPMSENAVGYLINRAGYAGRHVPHGWRSAFSTVMNERHRTDRATIDLMLAHGSDNLVEAAYNRALYMDRRRELAQEWADMLLDGFQPAAGLLDGPQR